MNPSKPQPGERKERGMLPGGPGGNGGKKAENPSTSRDVHSEQPPPADLNELEATAKELKTKRLRAKDTLQTAKARDELTHGHSGLIEDAVGAVVEVNKRQEEMEANVRVKGQRDALLRSDMAENLEATNARQRKTEMDSVKAEYDARVKSLTKLETEAEEELFQLKQQLPMVFRKAWMAIESKRQEITNLEELQIKTTEKMKTLKINNREQVRDGQFKKLWQEYDESRNPAHFTAEKANNDTQMMLTDPKFIPELPPLDLEEWIAKADYLRLVRRWLDIVTHNLVDEDEWPEDYHEWLLRVDGEKRYGLKPILKLVLEFYGKHENEIIIKCLGFVDSVASEDFKAALCATSNHLFSDHYYNTKKRLDHKQATYTRPYIGSIKLLYILNQMLTQPEPVEAADDSLGDAVGPTDNPAPSKWTKETVLRRVVGDLKDEFSATKYADARAAADGIVRLLVEDGGFTIGMPKQQGDQKGSGEETGSSSDDASVEGASTEEEKEIDDNEPLASESGFTSQRGKRREPDTDGSKSINADDTFTISSESVAGGSRGNILGNRGALPRATGGVRAALARANVNSGAATDSEDDSANEIVPLKVRGRRHDKSQADL